MSKTPSKAPLKLLLFAGNPGPKYSETRHNAGWMICDSLSRRQSLDWSEKFNSRISEFRHNAHVCRCQQPLAFMNKIGESLRKSYDFYNLNPENILVVHDDLELPFGTVQIRLGGGLGGHNGLRSVKQHLGTEQFYRLRFGIGRPQRGDVSSWVLSRFSQEELPLMDILSDRSSQLLEEMCKGNHNKILNQKLNILEGMPI